jgi:elongation factor P--beta-lysine ligase
VENLRKQKPMSFEDLLKDLQGQKAAQEDPNQVSLEELFNEAFMRKHSNSKSFAEFLEKGNFQVETEEDVNNIPDELFDRHIERETDFNSWKSMLDTANAEYEGK